MEPDRYRLGALPVSYREAVKREVEAREQLRVAQIGESIPFQVTLHSPTACSGVSAR